MCIRDRLLEGARFRDSPARKVVATSENLRVECERAYPARLGEVMVILPGTNLPRESIARSAARRQLGLPESGKLVLFVANDYERKGLNALLQAMAQLPVDTSLMVVGNPRYAPRYRQQAQRLGLGERTHFLGSLDDLAPAYWAADCLAHPTLEDSFAMVVLEAMGHRLPVVVSGPAHCGIAGQLSDRVQALLLPDPKDAQRLAELMGSVLDQPELAANLRRGGVEFAEQHSWERAALQYEQLYFQVASNRQLGE